MMVNYTNTLFLNKPLLSNLLAYSVFGLSAVPGKGLESAVGKNIIFEESWQIIICLKLR